MGIITQSHLIVLPCPAYKSPSNRRLFISMQDGSIEVPTFSQLFAELREPTVEAAAPVVDEIREPAAVPESTSHHTTASKRRLKVGTSMLPSCILMKSRRLLGLLYAGHGGTIR